MNIACLGWGSLIRDPGDIPLRRPWFNDGPLLPIEFARESKDRRITLVITLSATPVRSLWALMALGELEDAKKALADREAREEVKPKDVSKFVGFWSNAGTSGQGYANVIGRWASERELDAVVWTALPPGLKDKSGQKPTADTDRGSSHLVFNPNDPGNEPVNPPATALMGMTAKVRVKAILHPQEHPSRRPGNTT